MLDGEDLRVLHGKFAAKALTGISLRRVTGIGTDFSNGQLQGARFEGADLRECNFSGADLRGASFRNCKLAHADFEKANLGSLKLPGGKTLAPDFTGAEASKSQFHHAMLETSIAALGLGAPAAVAA